MIYIENTMLNAILIALFVKLIYDVCSKKIKYEKTNTFHQNIENFGFNDNDMYKLKMEELDDINRMLNVEDKQKMTELLKKLSMEKKQLNELEKQKKYDKKHGFPIFGTNMNNWDELFPIKKSNIKTHNNEYYFEHISEN